MTQQHLSETALEHYLLGGDEVDAATIEQHLLECDDCAAQVRAQIELEMQLGEVAHAATFCPGCGRLLDGDRCDACGAALVAGGYRIERVLVRTTHGRLYVAVDGSGNRVALKELAFVQAPTLESLAAFDRETKFLRALAHPLIPKFHASFIEGTGIHTRMYIAQDLVEGESLLARLESHWFTDSEIVDIARRVLEILIYLQGLSPMVFHRDIKPANLIARPDGSIALVDFGAARDVSETMGNTAVGTFGYMPMEQMAGIYDATTDLFALGASLLHLLTRREPWKLRDGRGVGLNVSPGLRAYLQRLCAPEPTDRFPDARAARLALDQLDNTPSKWPRPPRRTGSRRPGVIGLVALGGIGVGLGAWLALDNGAPTRSYDQESTSVRGPAPATFSPAPPRSPQVAPPTRDPDAVRHRSRPASPLDHDTPTIEALFGPMIMSCPPESTTTCPHHVRCRIMERLPSGQWPDRCTQNVVVPREIEAKLAEIPDAEAADLRDQFADARQLLERAGDRGAVAIGKITIAPAPGLRSAPVVRYFAVALGGPVEVALHGYRRQWLTLPDSPSKVGWVELVLQPAYDAASVVGNATTPTTITATLIHRGAESTAIADEPVSSRVTVDGSFVLPHFSPGPYHLVIATETSREELDLDLGARQVYDLQRRDQSGEVLVTSMPRARISIDGIETGLETPTKLKLSPGKHKIGFSYGTTKTAFPLTVHPGDHTTFHKDLE